MDWNSFRTNLKFSKSFRNLYPNQTVSFRSNPKKFFNPDQSEAHSKSIRTCNPNEYKLIRINSNFQTDSIRSIRMKLVNSNFQFRIDSEWTLIRLNPVYPNQSEWLKKIVFHSDWKFGLILINSDWPELSEYKFGLILNGPRVDWDSKINFGLVRNETIWRGYKFRNDSNNFELVRNEFQSDWIRSIRIIPKYWISFGLIRIDRTHVD